MLLQLPEERADNSSLGDPAPLMLDTLRDIYTASGQNHIHGLFLEIGPLGGAWARSHDLMRALRAFKQKKKAIHCHIRVTDNLGFALAAAACDRITMSPAGDLTLVGVALEVVHVHGLLSKVGVAADLLQVGKYKGAADPLTQDTMSPEVRDELEAIVRGFDSELIATIAKGRHLAENRVKALLAEGPFDADTAKRYGLVDDVASEHAARYNAKQAVKAKVFKRQASETVSLDLFDIIRSLGEKKTERPQYPHVAMVTVVGNIVDGDDGKLSGVSATPFVRQLRTLAYDKNVKAVVLRIDSPGGSALASDRIWSAVRLVAQSKPVIASVGDMAASGGYYIASAASQIIAQPQSLIGSIGVVGGKVQVADLADRLGARAFLLKTQPNAGFRSIMRPFSPTERVAMQRMLNATYQRFLQRISTGQKLSIESIEKVAEGRLMNGFRAKQASLITQLGGLDYALAQARKAAKVPASTPIDVWPPKRSVLEKFTDILSGPSLRAPLGADAAEEQTLRYLTQTWRFVWDSPLLTTLLFDNQTVAVAMPWIIDIR